MAEKKKKIRFKAGAELSGKVNAVSATVYSETQGSTENFEIVLKGILQETPEDTPKEVDTVKIRFAIMKADAPEAIK
ncbi:hypothetical protein MTP09_05920 [Chryseobacterium suipulveris]|uniref:Uncharacterized protein n=1 Tax=Chryseobacterium suipulveris TaxID=2929800 RepID=A0ABY4BSJ4_9FLAO|nr:hypothetical protein [Chryseobacterium suipulveris]UOE42172.1 hypothetical protein MTP09_05920 [Chryseobacterium suipulveris]